MKKDRVSDRERPGEMERERGERERERERERDKGQNSLHFLTSLIPGTTPLALRARRLRTA